MSKDKTVPFEQAKAIFDLSFRVSRTTISVIDAMTQRGAVKGEELSQQSVNCVTSVSKQHRCVNSSSQNTKSNLNQILTFPPTLQE